MALSPQQEAALARLKIYPVLMELVACLCDSLGESAPCFCGLLIGDDLPVEYAGDCEDGAGFVRVTTAYPSAGIPEPDQLLSSHAVRAYQIGVGVLRNAPYGDGGEPPEPDEVKEHSLVLLADHQITWDAIVCCFQQKYDGELNMTSPIWTPFPNEGGIDGGEWVFTLQEPF
jgi:hypothetical protein